MQYKKSDNILQNEHNYVLKELISLKQRDAIF